MAKLIAFPFRVTASSAIVTREDGTEQCFTEELAELCLTRPGERELVPQYGLSDPVFDEFNQTELVGRVSLFLPNIRITDVESSYPKNGEHRLVIRYAPLVDQQYESEDSFDV